MDDKKQKTAVDQCSQEVRSALSPAFFGLGTALVS